MSATVKVSRDSFRKLVAEAKNLGCTIKDLVDLYVLGPQEEIEVEEEEEFEEEEED